MVRCLRGQVDESAVRDLRFAPLRALANGPKRADGRSPQGAVSNLRFTVENRRPRMSYTDRGQSYFMAYEPRENSDCCLFTMNTVSCGELEGVSCRRVQFAVTMPKFAYPYKTGHWKSAQSLMTSG